MWRRFSSKGPLPFLALTLGTLVVMGVTFVSVRGAQEKRETQSQAASSVETVNLILVLAQEKDTKTVTIEKAIAHDGYIPWRPFVSSNAVHYELQQTEHGNVISHTPLLFEEYFLSEPEECLTSDAKEIPCDPRVFYEKPQTIVFLPYRTTGTLHVKNLQTQEVYPLNQLAIQEAVSSRASLSKNPRATYLDGMSILFPQDRSPNDSDEYLDIVFIASHYTDFDLFHADVQAMVDFLFDIPSVSAFTSHIRVTLLDNTEETECRYAGRVIDCNTVSIYAIASQVPHDTIVVVENNNTYGGAAIGGGIAVTYRAVESWAREVMVHEFGHSFGQLLDEYIYYGIPYGGDGSDLGANCDVSPCSKWSDVPGAGCFEVCTFTNAYRAGYNDSIMRTLYPDFGPQYGIVGEQAMQDRLTLFTLPPPPPTAPPSPTPLPPLSPHVPQHW